MQISVKRQKIYKIADSLVQARIQRAHPEGRHLRFHRRRGPSAGLEVHSSREKHR